MKEQGKRKDLDDNVIEVANQPQGNSRSYTVSRLKAQHPKLFEEVKAGTKARAKAKREKTAATYLGYEIA